jgi:hypothetical protein
MPSLTYTALRRLERLAFGVAAVTDISASTTDDSFNSTVTSLAGLVNGNWLLAAGFANAGNNGWHPVNASSSANKVTVGTNLVTESAGATVSLTGYKRGSGQSYGLDFEAALIKPTTRAEKHRVITWGGRAESNLIRLDQEWEFRTLPIHQDDVGQWREIFASLAAGESFTLDPYGTLASPSGEQFQAELLTVQHVEARVGVSQYFTFDLKVRDRAVL